MKKLLFIYTILLLLCSTAKLAAQPDIVFHHLTEKDGLSYNIVNCFLKDSRGMLWIGTYNGLNRYDGAHFYVFRSGPGKDALPNNTVHKLAEDADGNIWGGTDGGIFCYYRKKNIFKTYRTTDTKDYPVSFNILCDQKGDIWASNRWGLIKFNSRADSFEQVKFNLSSPKYARGIDVRKNGLAESTDGKGFWIATRQGLFYYDKVLQQFTSSENSKDSSLFTPGSAAALCTTNFGHYWYFDNEEKKLVGFDPDNRQVKYQVQPKEFGALSYGATVYEDNNHLLWISTWNYEIFTIDYLHESVAKRVKHDDNDVSSIAGDFFWAAMQDESNTLWLGTVGGISKCNTNRAFYKVHNLPKELFRYPNPAIEYLTENRNDQTIWLTTTKRLLVQYDPFTNKTQVYNLDDMPGNRAGEKPVHLNKIIFLSDRLIFFSDYGAWVKKGNENFKPFSLPAPADTLLFKDAVKANDSILYCSTFKQTFKWNIRSNAVENVYYNQSLKMKKEEANMVFLTMTGDNELWMLNGYDWLSHTNNTALSSIKFSSIEKDGSNGYYTSMIADKKNHLWITKKGDGLFYYNTRENKYRQFLQYDGLVMDHVMAAAVDNNDRIWAAAYNQFSVYNPALNSFYNFTLPLSTNNYLYVNFITTLSNGNIIGNVADKIVEFYPSKLKSFSINSQPIISLLRVSGVEKVIDEKFSISLSPSENNIQLKFGLLTDNSLSPYDMFYILEGAEKSWTNTNASFEASYNSLPPGDYTFKVKAIAKDKSWQTKEAVLKIHIDTPFYKTWWFASLIALAFLAAVYAVYRYRLHQQQQLLNLQSKAQLLEKEKTQVLYESLKQQLNPHFLFNSLTSLSGLIEMDQKMASTFLEQMSKTYRYILKSSDSETVALKDEVAFVNLYIKLQQTRFKNGLIVNIDIPSEYNHYKIAPVTLQNMIENAIKHNVIDIESPLVIDIFIDDDYLVVKNNLQKKNVVETSNKRGLENLKSLYHYLISKPVIVEETKQSFAIKIPLI